MKASPPFLTLVASLLTMSIGCAADQQTQEHLGLGIVVGTLGAQQEQVGASIAAGSAQKVVGQVVKLEGGAYVVQQLHGAERRLPLDENTRIDRPAHVGDRIEAYLDDSGRALLIRNIDQEYWRDE
jgi:hypothetical protein